MLIRCSVAVTPESYRSRSRGCGTPRDRAVEPTPMQLDVAIAGLGITEMGKVYGRSALDFAADAVRLAVDDAGLELADVDGLLVNPGLSGGLGIGLAAQLGLYDLPLLSVI